MKKLSKVLVLVLSAIMVLAMSASVFAAPATDCTITVSKNYKDQTYHLYQIFTAETVAGRTSSQEDGISYKLMSGKTDLKATVDGVVVDGAQWFTIDSVGNITVNGTPNGTPNLDSDAFRAWVKAYGKEIGTGITAASDNDVNVKWTDLTEGYYYITTTTGSLVTVDSIKPNATVNDKNTIPSVDKKITGATSIDQDGKKALAQIGTDVTYTATVTIGKGSKNVVFHDTMDAGLTFKGNNNVTVTPNKPIAGTDTWYTIKETPDSGDTLTITFKDGLEEGTVITIVYKATINANAVTKIGNTAKVTYGDNNTSTKESKTDTYNAEIGVIKYDGDKADKKYLGGAGFKLKNSDGKYYKLTGTVISWVDSEADGDEHFSNATDGKVPAFTGLANGIYTLVETTVPSGYNTAEDTKITIAEHDYAPANLSQKAEIENNTGVELPGTGGIGTTVFYVLGSLLVIGCGIVLVSRRRMQKK